MENTPNYHIVNCSGASNTGKFSDEVARKLMHRESTILYISTPQNLTL
jgi:uncharacterized metal-binding protein